MSGGDNSRREFDLVVMGATGFTGRLVAEHLFARHGAGGELRWAIAGRDAARLKAVRAALGAGAERIETLVADSRDEQALARLAAGTRVVLSTVGPYARYGSPLVAACVENGTHYCDLAGEVQWIRRMIDTHHEQARKTGARIVHCCGFDSVPMDLGVRFLQREAESRFGGPCESVTLLVRAMRGSASGGTAASILNLLREAGEDREVRRILGNPYALNPDGERRGPDGPDQKGPRYDEDGECWTAPFIMSAVNTRVVRRSNALAGYPYGRDFRYREAVWTGKGARGYLKAALISSSLFGLLLGGSFGFSRRLLERFVLPAPGEGPDARERQQGFFKLLLVGRRGDEPPLSCRVTGERDPGYGATSRMIAECALSLAGDDGGEGGVLTPAVALPAAILPKLEAHAGLRFEVLEGAVQLRDLK